ncbi:ABC transporter ATP-binding protein [Microbacterium sp. ET2]|uniref:ABC transporter ATP-binding protein n=1 Tax=Microbacterium albipurpureum TaxID=3050384 RepID=UPI00259C85B5|nr:ABC transporter ATP-binding protein [Microbacterium sp. ET2 (Ac-2212)]WJL97011.1 ABC transporter ATP-binding protein [Microbacterium sp. ET2 (Ac-2212)]
MSEVAAPSRSAREVIVNNKNNTEVDDAPLLEARDIRMSFAVRGRLRRWGAPSRRLTAVDDVSLTVRAGEVVAIVGESGSGKSTIAKVLSQLQKQTSGDVLLKGAPARARGTRAFRRYCTQVQLIFQDPFASLNPLRTIRYHLADPLKIHGRTEGDTDRAVRALLERVKLTPPERYIDKYPHELSGGQRQRVSIARALAAGPDVLLADEPVSMLDVSIRLGVLNLLKELKEVFDLGILYITHDIASARHFSDRVLVMYAGQIVESGGAEEVTQDPKHPYTHLLISSAPNPENPTLGNVDAASTSAEPPSLIDPPTGCRFHPRCPWATAKCAAEAPPEIAIGADRVARCWAYSTEPTTLPLPRVGVPSP